MNATHGGGASLGRAGVAISSIVMKVHMPLLVHPSVGGGVLTWRGFAHFDHVQASAPPSAHAILPLRAPLTSDASLVFWRLNHRLQSERNLRNTSGLLWRCHESLRHIHLVVVGGGAAAERSGLAGGL